ncbi:hypothetical protein JCM39068_40850 [Desulfocastanea catecholica]
MFLVIGLATAANYKRFCRKLDSAIGKVATEPTIVSWIIQEELRPELLPSQCSQGSLVIVPSPCPGLRVSDVYMM